MRLLCPRVFSVSRPLSTMFGGRFSLTPLLHPVTSTPDLRFRVVSQRSETSSVSGSEVLSSREDSGRPIIGNVSDPIRGDTPIKGHLCLSFADGQELVLVTTSSGWSFGLSGVFAEDSLELLPRRGRI